MRYYAVGIQRKKDTISGEVVWANVLIPLTEVTRVGAVKQAQRIAKRDKIQLEGVYPERNTQSTGGILTKNMKKQREAKRQK
jgi:hypothetical protein